MSHCYAIMSYLFCTTTNYFATAFWAGIGDAVHLLASIEWRLLHSGHHAYTRSDPLNPIWTWQIFCPWLQFFVLERSVVFNFKSKFPEYCALLVIPTPRRRVQMNKKKPTGKSERLWARPLPSSVIILEVNKKEAVGIVWCFQNTHNLSLLGYQHW